MAGIAAGAADHYTGATPQAPIVSLDVMDDNGVARTSDVIAAAQWILANKEKYNIRVANFSLHSSTPSHFFQDPLDQAVEKLWFNNVVVVAAAGNYGFPDKPSGVLYAPGNDPFVITVGAIDIGGTKNIQDDVNAPWSAYGRTPDGFMKPELAAPGRYMVGPVPEGSTLAIQRADKVVAKGYIQLSGTSFAAPVISGAAAQILAKHPEFTPDQVKGALMASTKDVDGAAVGSVGVGELQMSRASTFMRPPNPNKALEQWVKKNTSRATRPSTRSAGSTSPRRTSPGTRSRGTRSPGPTRPGTWSPGPTFPGPTSPGQMSPGPTSPGPTSPGRTPPTRMPPRATRPAIRAATS